MTLTPQTAALTLASALSSAMLAASAVFGLQVLRRWDLSSGSELQLKLERRTYLVATLLSYAFFFECVSLFFLVRVVDEMHPLFVGAMCAVGTLSASQFGYPALLIKTVTFLLASVWLILNHADSQSASYPLIRPKYVLLMVIAPVSLAGTAALGAFFWQLKPHVITSCCGALFGAEGSGVIASEVAAFRPEIMIYAFYAVIAMVALCALYAARTDKGHAALGALSLAALGVSIASVISFISCYIYELPSHHCPFCVFQADYGFIGYPMYITMFGGAAAGLGAGALGFYKRAAGLEASGPRIRRRLALWSMGLFLAFALIAAYKILATDFKLFD